MMKNTKMSLFNNEDGIHIFEKLISYYDIIAPVNKVQQGRLSDTDVLTYDVIKSFDEIDFSYQTSFSPKKSLFPIRETIFSFNEKIMTEPEVNIRPMIILMRSCDIHAVSVIDEHFLKDSMMEDNYYQNRRKKLKIFLIECPNSFEDCYCVSLNTNKTDDYSAFIRKVSDGYELIIKDDSLNEFFPESDKTIQPPVFAEKNECTVNIPQNIDTSIFDDEMWKEYSARCIACGRCNTSCPTCTCFTVQDTLSDEKNVSERRRIWSACHVKDFSLLAGNHDFRVQNGDRMRYKTLHKIYDFKKRTGLQMCVGCGRCDLVCPVYIGMFKCIEKINNIIETRKQHE